MTCSGRKREDYELRHWDDDEGDIDEDLPPIMVLLNSFLNSFSYFFLIHCPFFLSFYSMDWLRAALMI